MFEDTGTNLNLDPGQSLRTSYYFSSLKFCLFFLGSDLKKKQNLLNFTDLFFFRFRLKKHCNLFIFFFRLTMDPDLQIFLEAKVNQIFGPFACLTGIRHP